MNEDYLVKVIVGNLLNIMHVHFSTGHDDIIVLIKHHKPSDDSACSDYSGSLEGSYVSVPSPLGKLRSMTKGDIRRLDICTFFLAAVSVRLSLPFCC